MIFQTENLRVTLLTTRLLRVETGSFTDLPTQTVWNRNLGEAACTTEESDGILTIETGDAVFCLSSRDGHVFYAIPGGFDTVTDFEKGNLLGTARTLDTANGPVKLDRGILSRSGVSVLDDSKSLLLLPDGSLAPRPECTDKYYFAYGHSYRDQLRDFFRLTGPVPLIPKFALGNWWSRYRAYTQEEYRTLMAEFLRRELPITVATIDMDWHWTDVVDRFGPEAKPGKAKCKEELLYNTVLPGWTGYSWNTELFPDHRELLSWLHDRGFHVTLNVHPSQGIRFFENCYDRVCARLGRDPAEKALVPFDIADPEFRRAYFEELHHPLEAEGVDFWWLDWQQGTQTSVPGLDPLWALNHYHTLDSVKGEKRPLILSRYAGLGSHRYPLGFSGDTVTTWKSLDFQPYFTVNAANAGYTWWSHDIGGHMQGVQDDELYLRWLQFGVFSPINRLHSSNSDFMGKEPWKRCWAVEKISEDFLRLRHALIPYLYSANYRTHTQGEPICQPLYYRWDREEAYEAKNEYIFGGQLLVCPVTRPMDKQLNLAETRVWLPEGRWTDILGGRIYRGGQWVTMHRDLDAIPVLAGEGAIVPMYRSARTNDLSPDQPLDIHLWRGNGHYELYEDDGETTAYEQGRYAITEFTLEESENTLRLTIAPPADSFSLLPETRQLYLRFRDITAAAVTVNGESVPFGSDIPVALSRETVIVELRDIQAAENQPKEDLRIKLLTRFQGSNAKKTALFRSARYPKSLHSALTELDALI